MQNHTALPWEYTNGAIYAGGVRLGKTFSVYDQISASESDDNGHYIVQACNAYPALVEALEACVYTLNNELPVGNAAAIEAKALARAALAQAKEA